MQPRAHLLQILDECYRGYQDSRWVLDAAGIVPRSRELATGMALVDGQLVAMSSRTVSAERVRFELHPYRRLKPVEVAALADSAQRYGDFVGREPDLAIEGASGARATPVMTSSLRINEMAVGSWSDGSWAIWGGGCAALTSQRATGTLDTFGAGGVTIGLPVGRGGTGRRGRRTCRLVQSGRAGRVVRDAGALRPWRRAGRARRLDRSRGRLAPDGRGRRRRGMFGAIQARQHDGDEPGNEHAGGDRSADDGGRLSEHPAQ